MDRVDGGNERAKQVRSPLEDAFRDKVEVILISAASDDSLAHLADDPPCNVGDEKDARLAAHCTPPRPRSWLRTLTASPANRRGSHSGDGHAASERSMYAISPFKLLSRAIRAAL